MKTRHLVLPQGLGLRNKVEAPRTGERMAKRCCGGVTIPQACDEATDVAADPVALAARGTVPGQWGALEGSA